VERANAEILRGLKTRTYDCLKKHGANWVNELPSMLWGNRTTPNRATGETPFFLVYGAEACCQYPGTGVPLTTVWRHGVRAASSSRVENSARPHHVDGSRTAMWPEKTIWSKASAMGPDP
jgi:hypothetical protein